MGDIITYESLYEIVRNEKTNDALQKIPDKLIEQISEYLKTKILVYKEAKEKNQADLEKIRTQVLSVRRLIKSFYELRERKIINLAIMKSRTKSLLEEENNLLDYEKKMLEHLKLKLDIYRNDVLLSLLNAKVPYTKQEDLIEKQEKDTQEHNKEQQKQESENKQENPKDKEIELLMIRFLVNVPQFLGRQGEIYGPFSPGDIANLDKSIVKILIRKNVAEIIHSE